MILMNIKAEPDLREAAHAVARKNGMSLSAFIRRSLRNAIAEQGEQPPRPSMRDNRTYDRRGRAHV